jgi:hypothetical protein
MLIAALVAFLLGMTGIVLGNMFWFMIVGEVNRRKTDAEQVSYFGNHFAKAQNVLGEYRKHYPNGKLHFYLYGAITLAVAGIVAAALLVVT